MTSNCTFLVVFTLASLAVGSLVSCQVTRYQPLCGKDKLWNNGQCIKSHNVATACDKLEKPKQALCSSIIKKRTALLRVYSHKRALTKEKQKHLSSRVYAYIEEVPKALNRYKPHAQRICKLRDNGRVHCMSLASLLSFYKTKMDRAILSDIRLLYYTHEHLSDKQNTLIFCGNGIWGSANTTSSQENVEEHLSENDESILTNLCKNMGRIDDVSNRIRTGGIKGGFIGISGISGFDPFSDYCGFEISSSQAQKFTDKTLEYLESMRQQCEATLQQGLMEGGQGTEGLPGGSAEKELDTATEITQNGDGTETVTTVDGEGNQVSETRDSTQDYDSVEVNYSDGSTGRSESKSFTDGSTYRKDTVSDGKGYETTTEGVVLSDGTSPRGVTWSDSYDRVKQYDHWPEPTPWNNNPTLTGIPKGCGLVDEVACENCKDFLAEHAQLEQACRGLNLDLCKEFGEAAACCSDASAFPADPRVVIPNPMGDFVCAGGSDIDTKKEGCNQKCSVAYQEDCMSKCMSSTESNFDWSLFDSVCIYADADWCFGSSGSIDLPGMTPPIGVSPQPAPVAQLEYMVLPHSELDVINYSTGVSRYSDSSDDGEMLPPR